MTVEFKAWPKIPREKGNIVTVTEKIDGTNACGIIRDGELVGMRVHHHGGIIFGDREDYAPTLLWELSGRSWIKF